jgi:tetratricopeptide (TPR) repeat protein
MPAMTHGKVRRRVISLAVIAVVVIAGGVGLWSVGWRHMTDPGSQARRAYRAGQWADAAELARKTLTARQDDAEALRLLARASVRLGRDTAALAIYQRRLDPKALEAEDHLLLGSVYQRQARADAAALAFKRVLDTGTVPPQVLEELARLCVRGRLFDEAIRAIDRLSQEPGWRARASMMLGTIRLELNNVPAAAELFRTALQLDGGVLDTSHDPTPLGKLIARTFLRIHSPDDALPVLRSILDRAPDPEAGWLLSRAYLQKKDKAQALEALKHAGDYRSRNPLEAEPGPYLGEARCEKCHSKIFRDSLTSRHTRTYHRGAGLEKLPLPGRPIPDPDDPQVTHTYRRRDGVVDAETRVGDEVFRTVIEYAFGTGDRYLTMLGRDASGHYRMSRLSYFQTPEGNGWDRTTLDMTHPTRAHPAEFQGEAVGVRDGLAKCLYCHVTNPRTGHDALGPEMADRAIGCERCHGPGGNHVAALEAGFPESAIVNPAGASPQVVTTKQCNDCHVLEHRIRHDDPDNVGWVRSQGIGWTRSRCNTESGGAFGCVTCHDPHRTSSATSTVEYEAKCLKCHGSTNTSAGKQPPDSTARAEVGAFTRACPVSPAKGCIECHMPRLRIASLHMELTDHYIRVNRGKP